VDPVAQRVANALVGNAPGAATLEMALVGPEVSIESDALVALHGARFGARIDGVPMPLSRPVLVRAGATLQVGQATAGCYGYLAVAGGLDVPLVLGSRGTCLPGGFGGLDGAPLAAGARLPLVADVAALSRARFGRLTAALPPVVASPRAATVRWFVHADTLPGPGLREVRVLPGIHAGLFTAAARAALAAAPWRVAAESNRMGLRLQGPALPLQSPTEIVTQATCRGTVQVPPGGAPIVLLADHQTTGGYPKIAEVIAADQALLAQLPPGASLRFVLVELAAADAAREAARVGAGRLLQRLAWEFGAVESGHEDH
jgi:antagonist of KipI